MSTEHEPSEQSPLVRTEHIFHEVLDAPAADRAALLETRCRGDAELRADLLSLLEAHFAEEALGSSRPSVPAPPRRIGPYQLDRLLGRGGMGAVHLAHRSDGQFQQQVAIKVIDLPLATELFRERFRQERQILAGLVHPFIARLLDGGVAEDGELYLVMEYVDGVAIDRHCRDRRLPLRERLSLFRNVCAAVHFAHQNLVVHRDLKADNILVLADGTPKLLDFGTAKLLAPEAGAPSGFTQMGLQAFTPSYASPEQVLGETITTASDTYSLGVLLHLLLTDALPYRLKDASTAELLRVVCNEEPPRPSAAAPATGERPDADLDAIVQKALRKEPRERYGSALDLSADLQAYLDGRPVQARRGTLRYRAGKFVRRNRLALGAVSLLFASLVAGLAGVLWQFRVATLERRRAEARSEDLRELSNSLLSEIDEAVKQLPGSTPVRRVLVTRVLEHLDRMAKDRAGDQRTRLDLIGAYTRLGNLQGNPYDQNLGDPDGALVSLGKALALAKALRPSEPALLGPLALAEQSRSEVLFGLGRTLEAVVSMRAAVDAFAAQAEAPGATPAILAEAAAAYGGLGDQLGQSGVPSLGDPAGAVQAYRQALDLALRALRLEPGFPRALRAVAIDHFKIGNVLAETEPSRAVDAYHRSLEAWAALPAADRSGTTNRRGIANTHRRLGLALAETLDFKGALAAYQEALGVFETLAAADPKDTRAQYDLAVALSNQGETYAKMLDPALNPRREDRDALARKGVELLDRSSGIFQRLSTLEPGNRGWASNRAYDQVVAGTLRQGLRGLDDGGQGSASGMVILRAGALAEDASIPTLDHAASALLTAVPERLRDPALAVSLAERLVALTRRRKPVFLLTLAQACRAARQLEPGRAAAREGLALLPPGPGRPRLRRLLELEAGS